MAADRTLGNEVRDFAEWHLGRRYFLVWAVSIADEQIRARVDAAQQCLSPWLIADYRRQHHITVHVCGFPARERLQPDDFPFAAAFRQFDALRNMAGTARGPFELEIGGFGSFSSAPYLPVADPTGRLEQFRQLLAVEGLEVRDVEYVPHITLGLYRGAHEVADIVAATRSLRQQPAITLPVRYLDLLAYEASVIGGPLQIVYRLDLVNNLLFPGKLFSLLRAP